MNRKLQRGFSLVELMCALLILGLGIAGLTEGITTALQSSKETERQSTAALLAAGQIELLRADGYVLEGEAEGEFDSGLESYSWKQEVTATEIDGLFEVTVTIYFGENADELFELKTLLFDPPLPRGEEEQNERGRNERRPQ